MNRQIKKILNIVFITLFLISGTTGLLSLALEQEIAFGGICLCRWTHSWCNSGVRYFSEDNFVGSKWTDICLRVILTVEAAEALAEVADELRELGLVLKLFDGYRPQEAVNHFIRWAEDVEDQKMKENYPQVDKIDVFKLGYIAKRSGHSRGSTIDLTLVDIITGEELDMGSGFDFLEKSPTTVPIKSVKNSFRKRVLKMLC